MLNTVSVKYSDLFYYEWISLKHCWPEDKIDLF